jgi:threonine dehydratase
VVVPDTAPEHKIAAIETLGAQVVRVSFADWWRAIVEHRHPGLDGLFIHPVSNPAILAGNGTIGLEILEDLPDADAIVAPFGGGGLSCGIACAARALGSAARVVACEVETAAPLTAALAHGAPTEVPYTATFVEGVGGSSVLAEMWPLARQVLAGSAVVTMRQVADAVRLLAERARLIVEGAAATTLAAVLSGQVEGRKIVCVISGGNLGNERLVKILGGEIP